MGSTAAASVLATWVTVTVGVAAGVGTTLDSVGSDGAGVTDSLGLGSGADEVAD